MRKQRKNRCREVRSAKSPGGCGEGVGLRFGRFWRRHPYLWSSALIVITAFVNKTADLAFPKDDKTTIVLTAESLTGRADADTVAKVRGQVVEFLTSELRAKYMTRSEVASMIDSTFYLCENNEERIRELRNKVDELAGRTDPDGRYRKLLSEIGNKTKGSFTVRSEEGWYFARKCYEILKQDTACRAPVVAEALLQIVLRQDLPAHPERIEELKEMTLFAIRYYERSAGHTGLWDVYKAMAILLYEPNSFGRFVLDQCKTHRDFEKRLRESRFLNDSFFDSQYWPLNNAGGTN